MCAVRRGCFTAKPCPAVSMAGSGCSSSDKVQQASPLMQSGVCFIPASLRRGTANGCVGGCTDAGLAAQKRAAAAVCGVRKRRRGMGVPASHGMGAGPPLPAPCGARHPRWPWTLCALRTHSTWPHELLAVPLPVRQASAAAHAAAGLHEGRLGPAQRWWGRPRTAAWAAACCAACWCVVQGMGR